ncbi:hypothetical protein [Micromonospora haikouensis]|uniref:hypothetical protein n=1 Tax=Micromonospora haikouensis TaxID=686309 RepID=UPI0033D7CBD0
MIRIPICPVCTEPVADQPDQTRTSADRSGTPWWHLVDNTPICLSTDGKRSQAAFVEDGLPVDSRSSTWLEAMSESFTIDGPYDPVRLGSAVTAAEHLYRWLHTATGPFSATMALPTPSDVAFLIGHLHRTNRLLARIHAQVGSYVLDRVLQKQFTCPIDDIEVHCKVVDLAYDINARLQDGTEACDQSARAAGVAWSDTRELTALTTANPSGQADSHAPTTNTDHEPTSPHAATTPPHPSEPSAAHLAELIGAVFGDEASFSPELTHTATRILGTLTTYLSNCLGPARPAAIATPQDFADLTTALTHLTHSFHTSLRQVVEHAASHDAKDLGAAHVAALHASMAQASDALRHAAQNLGAASYHAVGLDLPQDSVVASGSREGKANTPPSSGRQVERIFGEHRQGYDLTETRRASGGALLRVRIHRDAYQHQSYAIVEVLTPAMTWTSMTNEPASRWHAGTPYRSTGPAPLESLADRLFARADSILRTQQPTGSTAHSRR